MGSFPSLVTSCRHSASFTFFLFPSLPPICTSAEEQVTLYRTSVCLSVCLSINFANGLRIVDGWDGRFISHSVDGEREVGLGAAVTINCGRICFEFACIAATRRWPEPCVCELLMLLMLLLLVNVVSHDEQVFAQ